MIKNLGSKLKKKKLLMTFMTYHEIIKIAIGSIKKKKSQTRRNNEGIEIAKWSWK